MSQVSAAAMPRQPKKFNKNDFYRYCRIVHGWLSALAFLLLCFFAFTGLVLNHPEWTTGKSAPPVETKFRLSPEELDAIRDAEEPAQKLVEIASKHTAIKGAFNAGDQVGRELFVKLRGVRGESDIRAHMPSGNVTTIVSSEPGLKLLNELHRGEHAGSTWRTVIDISAVVLIALSIIGYLIFFSLRFRLRTALLLTAGSAIGAVAVFMLTIP